MKEWMSWKGEGRQARKQETLHLSWFLYRLLGEGVAPLKVCQPTSRSHPSWCLPASRSKSKTLRYRSQQVCPPFLGSSFHMKSSWQPRIATTPHNLHILLLIHPAGYLSSFPFNTEDQIALSNPSAVAVAL